MIANIRIDGDPAAVQVVTEALRTLLGDAAHLGTPQQSGNPKYAGSALTRGTIGATKVAERAATITVLIEQAKQGDQAS